MDERDREHLARILEHAQTALRYARAHGRAWYRNEETLDAVLMGVSQIGEAAKRVSPETLATIAGVPWANVRGMRTRIVHEYQQIDVAIIRDVVARVLPELVAAVARALSKGTLHSE